MKNLYESIKESLLDTEDIDVTPYIIAKNWAEKYYDKVYYQVSADGVITFNVSFLSVKIDEDNLPKGIKFAGTYNLTLKSCSKMDMSIFRGSIGSAIFVDCDLKGFTGVMNGQPSRYIFMKCAGNNTKWMSDGTGISSVELESCSGKWDFTKSDMNNTTISIIDSDCEVSAKRVYELDIQKSKSPDIFKNINVDYRILRIQGCKAIKNLEGINPAVETVSINRCNNLESLKGLENTAAYSLSFEECPNLDNSDYLPITLSNIVAHGNHMCWTDNEIAQKYPYISTIKGIPLHRFDPTLGGKVKIGAYGAVRSAARSHSSMGSTRGSLVLDRIKKIGKTVIWEKCKSRSYGEFEMMDDNANPKKNWNYVDSNGFNDCTGVGIEVGDEIVVYCASGSFGRSNGVSRDVVLGFTPKMVKTKDNGNRPAYDICILRPHKIAKEFFDKQI